jgi:hypothetical protein
MKSKDERPNAEPESGMVEALSIELRNDEPASTR